MAQKIDFWSIGRRFGRQKMLSKRGSPKNMKKQKNRKNDDAKLKSWKKCVFWNMTRFLQKNGGLNGWTITDVLLKTSDEKRYKNMHNGKQENQ